MEKYQSSQDTPPPSLSKDDGGYRRLDQQAFPILELDPDQYRDHLQDFELDQSQENELLETLWHIMSMMVDIGWGVDSIQLMLPEIFNKECDESSRMVEQKGSRKDDCYDEHL